MEEQGLGLRRTRPRDRTTGRGRFASTTSNPITVRITQSITHGSGRHAARGLDPEEQHHRRDSAE
ncbi:hypothetical protein EJB05_49705 [Eragrostis curvula]|uniref:Uncharacterized protein n=1 Tax=Eragrostis curvula TaxID=38414 RepID=A0A5J9T531_9POAL|nr:hypothetical protein EJB05_49705 [Eragrostis curvula]